MSHEPFTDDKPEHDKNADGEQRDPCERLFKKMQDAVKSGAAEAKQKARETAPDVNSAVGKAAYAISYGVAYGSSFGLTMAKELVTGVMKEGGTEGFKAGRDAAERAMSPKRKTGDPGDIVDVEYTVR